MPTPPVFAQVPAYPAFRAPALASFWQRVLAFLLDSVLLAVPFVVYLGFAMRPFFAHVTDAMNSGAVVTSDQITIWTNQVRPQITLGAVAGAGLQAVYWIFMWHRFGQTLGMRATGLECVDEVSARPLPLSRAALRSAFFWLPALLGALLGISALGLLTWIAFIVVAFDSRNMGLHDKAAHSLVLANRRHGMPVWAALLVLIGGWMALGLTFAVIAAGG